MQIGIGLPTFLRGVNRDLVLEWARRTDAGPFSSLGVTDRIVYTNIEPIVTLGLLAAATERVRLLTGILVPLLRNTGVLAKQIATIDVLSGGRLSLGLAVGGREDDYLAAPASYRGRGRRLEEQLATMKRIWSGEPFSDTVGAIGPPPVQPNGPEILIAALSPGAAQRAGRLADGFVASPSNPVRGASLYAVAEEARKEAGKSERLRFVGGMYFVLGEKAVESGAANLRQYYGFMGARDGVSVDGYISAILRTTPEVMKETLKTREEVGMDEVVLWPSVSDLDQIERVIEVIG